MDRDNGKLKTPSTDIGEMRSKMDTSFEAFNALGTDVILTNLNENNRDGQPLDYDCSPRRG